MKDLAPGRDDDDDEEDDSDVEELLAQLEDLQDLAPLQPATPSSTDDLLRRYETLAAQSSRSSRNGENLEKPVQNEDGSSPSSDDFNAQTPSRGQYSRNGGIGANIAQPLDDSNQKEPVKSQKQDSGIADIAVRAPSAQEQGHFASRRARGFSPPAASSGCSCFLSRKTRKKEKTKPGAVKPQDKEKVQEDDLDRTLKELEEEGKWDMDGNSIFDLKKTQFEFKKASKKEKQLTQEAQKFVNMVASSSARFTSSPSS